MARFTPEVLYAMNSQMNNEFATFVAYEKMASYCKNVGFVGAAKFFESHSMEEYGHYKKFRDILIDVGLNVKLETQNEISAFSIQQGTSLGSLILMFLELEEKTSASIQELYGLIKSSDITISSDCRLEPFLSSFFTEQIEEEALVKSIMDQMKILGVTTDTIYGVALHELDEFLGEL